MSSACQRSFICIKHEESEEVESAPRFSIFAGERINEQHLTRAEKLAAKGA